MTKIKSYFDNVKSVLKSQQIKTSVKRCTADNFAEALELAADREFKFIAYLYNEVKLGYFKNNRLVFADGNDIYEKYIIQARLFSPNEEILIQKVDGVYEVRIIEDGIEGNLCTAVDSASDIFGRKVNDFNVEGFVHLVEPGRKMSIVVPANVNADKYELITRSYITYDETTGQAGFGYYRWLDIAAVGRE